MYVYKCIFLIKYFIKKLYYQHNNSSELNDWNLLVFFFFCLICFIRQRKPEPLHKELLCNLSNECMDWKRKQMDHTLLVHKRFLLTRVFLTNTLWNESAKKYRKLSHYTLSPTKCSQWFFSSSHATTVNLFWQNLCFRHILAPSRKCKTALSYLARGEKSRSAEPWEDERHKRAWQTCWSRSMCDTDMMNICLQATGSHFTKAVVTHGRPDTIL